MKMSNNVKNRSRNVFVFMIITSLLLGTPCLAAEKTKLSKSKIAMSVDQQKNLKLLNSNGKVKWKILSGEKNISIKKSGNRTVVITAQKKGTAVIQAANNGKKYVCKVTVKAGQSADVQPDSKEQQTQTGNGIGTGQGAQDSDTGQQASDEDQKKEDAEMRIVIRAGGQNFSAVLYDNEAARRVREKLPLTLNMSEMNGNEKYYYMDEALPVDSYVPDSIHTGDLMLYGSDCLVLFYKSFQTSYRYTPLGRVEDPSGLAAALGTGNVRVTFGRAYDK